MRLVRRPLNIAPPLFSTLAIFPSTNHCSLPRSFRVVPVSCVPLVQIMPVCPQCDNRSFSNKEALLQHMKSSSAWHPFCSICDRRFVSQPAFDAVSFSPNTIVLVLDLQLLTAHGGQTPADVRLHNLQSTLPRAVRLGRSLSRLDRTSQLRSLWKRVQR